MPDYNILTIFSNYIFVSTVSAWFFAQVAKVIVNLSRKDRQKINNFLFGTGGMPSSHSAVVCALAVASIIQFGFSSFEFALSSVLAVIVIRDATGVRFEAGEQAKFLNRMIAERKEKKTKTEKQEKFKELLGHTPLQVFFGALLGIFIALLFAIVFGYIKI